MSPERFRFADAVRREWWVVALAVVAALVVGVLLAQQSSTAYVASSSVRVNPGTLNRYPGLASPDQALAAVSSGAFYEAAAATAGVDAQELKANAKAYLVGSPVRELVFEYRAEDEATARKLAIALAGQGANAVAELNAIETDRVAALAQETRSAIDTISGTKVTDPWQSADLAEKLWTARTALLGYEASLAAMQAAYVPTGEASATREGALMASAQTVAAALLVGLVLGVAIAGVREALLLRRANG